MDSLFPIDFIRQIIEQTLEEQHFDYPTQYFGGRNQVNLLSFYEQLQKEDEVNRYVEIYRDLTNQQNKTGLIMNGTIVAPENPTITNISSSLIIPMSFTCSFRVKLADRDMALSTINNLIAILKGRKQDIAVLNNGTLLKVGTIANNVLGSPLIRNRDYIGGWNNATNSDSEVDTNISAIISGLTALGFEYNDDYPRYLYFSTSTDNNRENQVMRIAYKEDSETAWFEVVDNGEYQGIVYPSENQTFKRFKVSMSFDSIRCDEPRNLNANEYCVISFGGSATLVSENVLLGNELTKLSFKKKMIKASTNISIDDTEHWLEPLELPSGNNADTLTNQLLSNKFITNTHTDSITLSLQYTFILDTSMDLIKQWFDYARYGIQANGTTILYTSGITPNMIYEVSEIWSSWGNIDIKTFNAKIVESIDIENTESDTLTISVPLQIQGVN